MAILEFLNPQSFVVVKENPSKWPCGISDVSYMHRMLNKMKKN